MTSSAQAGSFSKVIAQAWSDESYKRRLIDDPVTLLAQAGVVIPDGVEVRVVENTPSVSYLLIPTPPGDGEISEEALEQVSGGTGYQSFVTCLTV